MSLCSAKPRSPQVVSYPARLFKIFSCERRNPFHESVLSPGVPEFQIRRQTPRTAMRSSSLVPNGIARLKPQHSLWKRIPWRSCFLSFIRTRKKSKLHPKRATSPNASSAPPATSRDGAGGSERLPSCVYSKPSIRTPVTRHCVFWPSCKPRCLRTRPCGGPPGQDARGGNGMGVAAPNQRSRVGYRRAPLRDEYER